MSTTRGTRINRLAGKRPVSTIPFSRADMKVYLYCLSCRIWNEHHARAEQGFVVCLTPVKFIGSSAISQSCFPCLFPREAFTKTRLHSTLFLSTFSLQHLAFLSLFPFQRCDPSEFLWELSDIHICLLLHQKFHARLNLNSVPRL